MYIYADILIITNLYANFFLIKATARLTHSPIRNGKCVFAALIGSVFSLIILLPELNALALLAVRILSAVMMVITAFSTQRRQELYRTGLIFFFVSFLFAGVEYAFSLLDNGKHMLWFNSVLYVNISLITLVISTAASYVVLCLFRRFLDVNNLFDGDYTIIIMNGSRQISIKAICDSGNNLTDSFSGKPVIVCGRSSVSPLFEGKIPAYASISAGTETIGIKGWRIIPFSTIDSSGLMPSFLPTGVYIKNNENGKIKYVEAYIGISEREIEHAIFNPKIISD
ncbi:MAG: sigma-E processing peptidase SpoIIGA [Oscillospiraceae bacterium]|nr:sigma-E processing peptidase SpoIIGA [Oscillospiraceae bacterium]